MAAPSAPRGTLAHHILTLHGYGMSSREIAATVYGLDVNAPYHELATGMAYVRVVVGQRKGTTESAHDVRYRPRKLDLMRMRYQTDEKYRERVRKRQRDWAREEYATNAEFRERCKAASRAYQKRMRRAPRAVA